MLQLLHVVPAERLALGDRVRTGHASDPYVTVRGVERGEAGVRVTFGGRDMAVLYPPDEEVAIIECVFEDQVRDGMALRRH